jgi:hypothetical protein
MSKPETRELLLKNGESFGNVALELAEISKLEAGPDESDLATITAGCTQVLSLICC